APPADSLWRGSGLCLRGAAPPARCVWSIFRAGFGLRRARHSPLFRPLPIYLRGPPESHLACPFTMTPSIAIVGMACRYPDAASPQALWENALWQRRAFRRIPEERLRLADYLSTDRSTPDCVYSAEAALIEGFDFDRMRFKVAGSTYRSADLTHWL